MVNKFNKFEEATSQVLEKDLAESIPIVELKAYNFNKFEYASSDVLNEDWADNIRGLGKGLSKLTGIEALGNIDIATNSYSLNKRYYLPPRKYSFTADLNTAIKVFQEYCTKLISVPKESASFKLSDTESIPVYQIDLDEFCAITKINKSNIVYEGYVDPKKFKKEDFDEKSYPEIQKPEPEEANELEAEYKKHAGAHELQPKTIITDIIIAKLKSLQTSYDSAKLRAAKLMVNVPDSFEMIAGKDFFNLKITSAVEARKKIEEILAGVDQNIEVAKEQGIPMGYFDIFSSVEQLENEIYNLLQRGYSTEEQKEKEHNRIQYLKLKTEREKRNKDSIEKYQKALAKRAEQIAADRVKWEADQDKKIKDYIDNLKKTPLIKVVNETGATNISSAQFIDSDENHFFTQDGKLFINKWISFINRVYAAILNVNRRGYGNGVSLNEIYAGKVFRNTEKSSYRHYGSPKLGIEGGEAVMPESTFKAAHENIMLPVFLSSKQLVYLTDEQYRSKSEGLLSKAAGAAGSALKQIGQAVPTAKV